METINIKGVTKENNSEIPDRKMLSNYFEVLQKHLIF